MLGSYLILKPFFTLPPFPLAFADARSAAVPLPLALADARSAVAPAPLMCAHIRDPLHWHLRFQAVLLMASLALVLAFDMRYPSEKGNLLEDGRAQAGTKAISMLHSVPIQTDVDTDRPLHFEYWKSSKYKSCGIVCYFTDFKWGSA
jgi:hypothetical protein